VPGNSVSRPLPVERAAGSQLRAPTPFRIVVQTERHVVRVCPFGDVDIGTGDEIRAQIEHATVTGAKHVVLDLRGVTFLDSTGLHLALDADAASRSQGWKFELIGGPPDVQRVFELTGARARLPFISASELAALLTDSAA
jgi:anti-anti-sigma factor